MKRAARLQAAKHWLPTFNGKTVVRGYAKWFGVDLECALKELQLLGVQLDPQYVQSLETSIRDRAGRRAMPQPEVEAIPAGYGSEWDDDFAHIAGFTSGGAPFGVTWEEMKDLDACESMDHDDSDAQDNPPDVRYREP